MRIKKRAGMGRKLFLMALAVVLLAAALPVTAGAAPMPSSGSLTIHKYALEDMDSVGLPNDGNPAANIPSDAVPLAGVEFSVWQVDPVAVAAGSVTTRAQAWQNILPATEQTGVTDANGEVIFSSLPQGLYYVAETANSGNTVSGAPFVVSVPMQDPAAAGSWITNVHAYPKNQPLAIDKFVGTCGTTDYYEVSKNLPVEFGEQFNWYIRTQLPADINPQHAEYYDISDTLRSYFDYQPGSVKIYILPASDSDLKNCPVLDQGDYTVNYDAATNTLSAGLTAAGVTKVKSLVDAGSRYCVLAYGCVVNNTAPQGVALYSGAKLEYSRDTTGVSYNSGTQGAAFTLLSAKNNAGITMNANNANKVTVEVTAQPEVHTGKIGITKLADGTNKLLSGAEFGIAKTKADAQAGSFIAAGTTDANGELTFNGLKYGLPGDGPTKNSNNTTFWLAETKAPGGYKPMKDPVEVTFSYQQDSDGTYYFARVNVYNVKSGVSGETGTTPKTGDTSNLPLYLGIMALALAGSLTVLRIKRKKAADGTKQ